MKPLQQPDVTSHPAALLTRDATVGFLISDEDSYPCLYLRENNIPAEAERLACGSIFGRRQKPQIE